MGFYSHYKGKSCGRCLGAIEVFCSLTHAEEVVCGNTSDPITPSIFYQNKPFAKVTWSGTDTPVFEFLQDPQGWFSWRQQVFGPFVARYWPDYKYDGNVLYVIQELAKMSNPTNAEIKRYMQQHLQIWTVEEIDLFISHMKTCSDKLRQKQVEWKRQMDIYGQIIERNYR